jgi:hypothetical protein
MALTFYAQSSSIEAKAEGFLILARNSHLSGEGDGQ